MGGSSGQILTYSIENLNMGIAIVTAHRDLDNNLCVRCKYCAKVFDISEEDLGNIVKCPYCDERLQINDFTTDSITIENKSIGKEKNKKGFLRRLFKR